jgi:hypothetical protein
VQQKKKNATKQVSAHSFKLLKYLGGGEKGRNPITVLQQSGHFLPIPFPGHQCFLLTFPLLEKVIPSPRTDVNPRSFGAKNGV